jgi:biopolymer transport protein ExbD
MQFRSQSQEDEAGINLTPLIDVVFLLLIFFMVSTTFDTTSELKIELPQASADNPLQQAEMISITIDPKGAFYLNDKRLKSNKAELLLLEMHRLTGGNKDLPVVIQSDSRSPVQSLVTAMDVVGQMGMHSLSIATTKPATE